MRTNHPQSITTHRLDGKEEITHCRWKTEIRGRVFQSKVSPRDILIAHVTWPSRRAARVISTQRDVWRGGATIFRGVEPVAGCELLSTICLRNCIDSRYTNSQVHCYYTKCISHIRKNFCRAISDKPACDQVCRKTYSKNNI